jgi:lipopolysaccharide cholinephosphotransferase
MIFLTQKELRDIQLSQLTYIDQVCRDKGIEYTLAGGSLIGAVRHGGYIPWDDDIDIELTRPNYEQLMAVLMEDLPEPFSLLYYKVHKVYLPFAKLYDHRTLFKSKTDTINRGTGVFLDIFPMDILPDDPREREKFKAEFNKKALALNVSTPYGLDYASASKRLYFIGKAILWLPAHLRYRGNYRRLAESLDDYMRTYEYTDNRDLMYLKTGYKTAIFPREIWQDYEDCRFEGLKVRKLKDHDSYLKRQYGDYMTLPPESERVNHAYYQWYWKEQK